MMADDFNEIKELKIHQVNLPTHSNPDQDTRSSDLKKDQDIPIALKEPVDVILDFLLAIDEPQAKPGLFNRP
jgi:hypothetical protein